jgi:hypothetical protein
MECPENLDHFLNALLRDGADESSAPLLELDEAQRTFIERMLDSVTTGSKSIFVVLHPNDRMQYMLLNTDRTGAITLLAQVMQRTGEALEADVE